MAGACAVQLEQVVHAHSVTLLAGHVRDDAARIHDEGAVAHLERVGEVVRDHEGRDVIAFGDVVMHELATIAADLDLPLQIHTGSGQYEKTNPIGLLSLIQSHPQTKFHLLHGGFPWVDDTYALLLAAPNVYSDTCWIPYLSTHTAKNYLITALEVADTHRLTWGCDTWMPEDSVGALLAMEHTLARALADMITDGAATFSYACYIAKRILADNAKELFGI